jgi:lipoprotein signal peptidase
MQITKKFSLYEFILHNLTDISHLLFIFFIIGANFGLSFYVRNSNFFYVSNENPVGFAFGYYSSVLILVFITFCIFKYDLIHRSTINSIMILSGLYSNFLEKLYWGNVADYMNVQIAQINLADIQILLGLFLLNIDIWTKKEPTSVDAKNKVPTVDL